MLGQAHAEDSPATKTPIKYLVVIFDENNSFDHYFGTYPSAANPPGEPLFYARRDTPSINGLTPELRSSRTAPSPSGSTALMRLHATTTTITVMSRRPMLADSLTTSAYSAPWAVDALRIS